MGGPLHTILCERLGARAPIIQTAMGWIAEPSLVIATSNAGAFGFLGAAVMTPDEAREKIKAVREGTDRAFGVNFHMFQPGAEQIVDLIIANREQVRAVSFGRGPNARMIARFRDAGILCIPTVGAVKHAQKMIELGVDMVSVQGGEGGDTPVRSRRPCSCRRCSMPSMFRSSRAGALRTVAVLWRHSPSARSGSPWARDSF